MYSNRIDHRGWRILTALVVLLLWTGATLRAQYDALPMVILDADGKNLTDDESKQIHKMIWQIADLVCPMLTSMSEQGFVSEYAYAIDYVIRHNGNLEQPVIGHFFPSDYPDYKYDEGIAEEIHEYEIM